MDQAFSGEMLESKLPSGWKIKVWDDGWAEVLRPQGSKFMFRLDWPMDELVRRARSLMVELEVQKKGKRV